MVDLTMQIRSNPSFVLVNEDCTQMSFRVDWARLALLIAEQFVSL